MGHCFYDWVGEADSRKKKGFFVSFGHLPIYKSVCKMSKMLADQSQHFAVKYRHQFSGKMSALCVGLAIKISRANAAKPNAKAYLIQLIIDDVCEIESINKMSYDIRASSRKNYVDLMEVIDETKRQAIGWHKKTTK